MGSHLLARARFAGILVFLLLVAGSLQAAVVWDEAADGDLSNDRLLPTSIALAAGTNSVLAEMPLFDLDYFTIVVPEGHEFSHLVLESYAGDDAVSFIGVARGTQMPVPTNTTSAAGLLGWAHFGESTGDLGNDFLPRLGTGGFGAEDFVPPLASGAYTFWIQQVDGLSVAVQLDFVVTEVPGTELVGYYNGDDTVDAADYTIWRDTLGATGPGLAADGDKNEVIDVEDYNIWKAHFGESQSPTAASAVPEPASFALGGSALAVGFAASGRRRPTRALAATSALARRSRPKP